MIRVLLAFAGCSGEYGLQPDKVPPAEPPGAEDDPFGDPPDWQDCFEGWRGLYSNLTVHDEWVDPRPTDDPAPTTPDGFDYWSNPSFERSFEPTLDFGQNWWPVDEGLEGDPKYFAVYWHAWLYAEARTDVAFSLGSQDDAWVYLNGTEVLANPGIHEYDRQTYDPVRIDGGVYRIEVWFAHRGSENSGFSLRVVSGDVQICYPDFGTDATAP